MIDYLSKKRNKWVVLAIGIVIGLIFGSYMPNKIIKMLNGNYNRASLDNYLLNIYGDAHFPDVRTDELVILAYDYNGQEPRIFSKTFLEADPSIYDVSLNIAVGASAAAPIFFDPKQYSDQYEFGEILIDGGVIGNDPSIYAYNIANRLHNHEKIRMISLGTGSTPQSYKESDLPSLSKFEFLGLLGEFMFDIDQYTVFRWLSNKLAKDEYARAQVVTDLPMDKVDPATIQELIDMGEQMWTASEDHLKQVLEKAMDTKHAQLLKLKSK